MRERFCFKLICSNFKGRVVEFVHSHIEKESAESAGLRRDRPDRDGAA